MVVILCGRWWVGASYAGAAGAGETTRWNLAGPQRIIALILHNLLTGDCLKPSTAVCDEVDRNS